jgi:dipeptidyl aminopeptidase/acylaminoacyl peptidase
MDLARVGIWGASAGGYGSTRALIERPDVFTVAVSVCGNHDDRLYHAGWTERFFGLEGEFDPEKRSNIAQAHRLEGRLLLVHGDLDDNVLPAHSLQLFDALLAHGKDADLLIVPNADHGMAARFEEWFSRRWDFLLRHLARQEPDA